MQRGAASMQHNRASPTRAMCLADVDGLGLGLDGKVDASESQTLARDPGPRGANGTCASHVETKRETKHL
jgi:hypothetical protein